MNAIAECTVSEKLLLSAYQLEQSGQTPFSAEALIVAAWQKYPGTFGLRHFVSQYPDSNKVLASIMGEKGLTRRGWFAKVGQKTYALTREGRQVVRRLRSAGDVPEPVAPEAEVKLNRDQERFLQPLLASTAMVKYQEGLTEEFSFADACRFWGITENLRGDHVSARLEEIQTCLGELDRLLGLGHATLSNGRSGKMHDAPNPLGSGHRMRAARRTGRVTSLPSAP